MYSKPMVALLALAFGTAVLAADLKRAREEVDSAGQKLTGKQEELRSERRAASGEQAKQSDNMRRASNIIGANVSNSKGETLGEVKDLVMNMERSEVAYAVVSAGGVLGVGARWHAVPINSLKLNVDRDGFVMNMDKSAWNNAPGFEKDHWPDFGSASWNRENDRYYR